jgi:hypothetical protein
VLRDSFLNGAFGAKGNDPIATLTSSDYGESPNTFDAIRTNLYVKPTVRLLAVVLTVYVLAEPV